MMRPSGLAAVSEKGVPHVIRGVAENLEKFFSSTKITG
jgi:hypothetical protein